MRFIRKNAYRKSLEKILLHKNLTHFKICTNTASQGPCTGVQDLIIPKF